MIRRTTRLSMKNVKRIIVGLVAMIFLSPTCLAGAISSNQLYMFSQNDILFYDPAGCTDGASNLSSYNNLVIGEAQDSSLKEVVKAYGQLAMDLQREWGTPWEVVFAQMEMESNVGRNKNSIAGAVEANGYYNWLGITGDGGQYSVGQSYISSSGRKWAQYPSVENMIKAWAGEYIARNGYYDKAFSNNLNPNSYNLRGFLNDFIMVYAPPSENDTSRYITSVMSFINGSIKEAREEMGWPSAEELARQENIPIGGRHPLSSSGSSSSSSDGSSNGGCTMLTSSPDYNGSGYQGRLGNLHSFSQLKSQGGYFANEKMSTSPDAWTINDAGCGVMSLYAAYYLFSGQGFEDINLFTAYRDRAVADGYDALTASSASNYGSNLSSFTQMNKVEYQRNESGLSGDYWNAMVSQLQQGYKIIILVRGKNNGGSSYFTDNGHYMLLDHYNAEKDMIYLFDPAMYQSKLNNVVGAVGEGNVSYNNMLDGIYISRTAMEQTVKPIEKLVLSYGGCYNGNMAGGANVCRASLVLASAANVSMTSVPTGGMTYEEAKAFMQAYRNEASLKKKVDYGAGQSGGTVIGNGYIHYASGCSGGALNNCVAFSQWFVNNYTTAGPSFGQTAGSTYATKLINEAGFENGGQTPAPYAIFSTGSGTAAGDNSCGGYYNHTGVVLGINKEKGEAYIGEASCSQGYTDYWPGVHVKKLSEITNTGTCGYKYAYPGSKLKIGGN